MRFWWRRKKGEVEAGKLLAQASASNQIDKLADRLHEEGRIDQLEKELEKQRPDELDDAEKESWYHLHGIAAFHRNEFELAFQRFQTGLEQCPGSGRLLFSLGQEYERRGEVESMFRCFDRALFPKVSGAHALAEARYAYLWNRHDRGWDYAAALVPTYRSLGVLDDTFLWLRGLPFFGQVWAYLAAFAQLDRNFEGLRQLTTDLSKHCTDFDFRELRVRIDALERGDRSKLEKRLRSSIQQYRALGFSMGSEQLQLHVILAQKADSETESLARLESVELGDKDFAWLKDMRLLALAERMHAHGNTQRERELRAEFLRRQPLLFEPDHALNFHLLSYQETLKPLYQQSRKHR